MPFPCLIRPPRRCIWHELRFPPSWGRVFSKPVRPEGTFSASAQLDLVGTADTTIQTLRPDFLQQFRFLWSWLDVLLGNLGEILPFYADMRPFLAIRAMPKSLIAVRTSIPIQIFTTRPNIKSHIALAAGPCLMGHDICLSYSARQSLGHLGSQNCHHFGGFISA